MAEAKRNRVEVVAPWFELEPEQFEFDWEVRLGHLAGSVKKAQSASAHAETDRPRRDETVRAMMRDGVSYRDIDGLLGLSHQRTAQIAKVS